MKLSQKNLPAFKTAPKDEMAMDMVPFNNSSAICDLPADFKLGFSLNDPNLPTETPKGSESKL